MKNAVGSDPGLAPFQIKYSPPRYNGRRINCPDSQMVPTEDSDNDTKKSQYYKSYKRKHRETRTTAEKVTDALTSEFGSFTFLTVNLGWFTLWVLINTGYLPIVEPFDPFPFNFLTLMVSLGKNNSANL